MDNLLTIVLILLFSFAVAIMIIADTSTRKLTHQLFKSVEKLEKEMGIETTPVTFTRENEHYQLLCVPKRLDRIRDSYRYPNCREKAQKDKEPIPPQSKE